PACLFYQSEIRLRLMARQELITWSSPSGSRQMIAEQQSERRHNFSYRHRKTLSIFEKSSVQRCLPSAVKGCAMGVFASTSTSASLRVITTHAEGSFLF